jgi:omega-6 fatty acid desaturase (delta-12 desaturase)
MNAAGPTWYPAWTNHFDPNSLIFDKRHRQQVLISDAFLLGMCGLLTIFGHYMGGFSAVVKYWGIPYLYTNHWLVMITYLQHTDPSLPHYSAESWSFQRGALCTMDRNLLGPVGPYLMRSSPFLSFSPSSSFLLTSSSSADGICETHVAHHVSSKIPHYHAWEATEALKKFLGPHYHSTNESMFVSIWKVRRCSPLPLLPLCTRS